MSFAKVSINLLDLWLEPRYNCERASQLLFNEPLKIIDEKNGFFSVEQSDGYSGWCDQRFLTKCPKEEFEFGNKSDNFIVIAGQAPIVDTANHSLKPHFLYYGTKLKGKKTKQGFDFTTPTGQKARLKPKYLKPIMSMEAVIARNVLKEALKWLGVPYLWGGITPAGFDCSGFVRQVLAQFNLYLPRDTKDQINAGKEVPRESIRAGDLLFFKRHVGIAVSGTGLIHCSVGAGGVRTESIVKGYENYRADLDRDFATARRIF
jgi:cell wall-associated NlpC family hydrolase